MYNTLSQEQFGQDLRQKIIDLSYDVFDTAPASDLMLEFFVYCLQQATHQLEYYRTNENCSYKEQTNHIKELSMNLINYSMVIYALTESIEKEVNKENSKFSVGYGNWLTPITHIRKQLNEACNNHFTRVRNSTHIIDSLKKLYLEIHDITLSDESDVSILTDAKILESVKLFFRNQCLLHFVFNYDYVFSICEAYCKEVKNAVNN